MSERDDGRPGELLHPCFTWTSHQGERFDLDSYLQSNQHGVNTWVDQELLDPEVQVVGDAASLRTYRGASMRQIRLLDLLLQLVRGAE